MNSLVEGLLIGFFAGFSIPLGAGLLMARYVVKHKEEVGKLVIHKLMQKAKQKKQQQPPSVEMIP